MTLEVTQEDRDAAADWCASQPFPSKQEESPLIRSGEYDHHSIVQAFAAHRQAADRKVVEWLRKENGLCDCHARSEGECGCGAWQDYKTKPLIDIADDIERGEHRK